MVDHDRAPGLLRALGEQALDLDELAALLAVVGRVRRGLLDLADVAGREAADPHVLGAQALGDGLGRLAQGHVELGELSGLADGAHHLAHPDLVAEALALLGVVHRQARLHHEHLEQLALLAVRDPVAGRQVDRHVAEQLARGGVQRRVERVERVPGVGTGAGLEVGHPRGLLERVGHPVVRHEAEHAPLVGLGELVEDRGHRRTTPDDLLADLLRAGHRRHHEGLALEARDRRDPVAQHLDDTARDLVEHLGQVRRRVDAKHQLVETTNPLSPR